MTLKRPRRVSVLTKEENERFTQVGPGTPMGELLRRYWHPVAAEADLDADPVRPVRLMGEDLVLFRSETGKLGLIGNRCAHRGISMAYGIPQGDGLRCAYHGWSYDTNGHVTDMPFEPACLPLKIPAYSAEAFAGIVWAYMGPQPVHWDFLFRRDLDRQLSIRIVPSNWLQCMDNSLDPVHFEHLHGAYGNYLMKKLGRPPQLSMARHLKIAFDVFEYGIYKRRLVEGSSEDSTDWTVGHPILFPNILAQGGPEQMSIQIRVPMDDTHTLHVCIDGIKPLDRPAREEVKVVHEDMEYDELGRVFADVIVKQDEMAWIGQGPITDRSTEHLATSDQGIILYRKVIQENLEKIARGEDPMGVIRDPAKNEVIHIRQGSNYTAFRQGVGDTWHNLPRESVTSNA
jgi:5,5'-dehydrodivanillate O-demethylase oxygenase subunit